MVSSQYKYLIKDKDIVDIVYIKDGNIIND